ncbi:MAG TPA: hypothetical protein DDZ09_08875 [Alcaligenes faecalis]|nr:hypothetical protein [Alcaligenes faecalis]
MQATLALLAVAAAGSYTDPDTNEVNYASVDALVYPICFNARHFIELFMKDSIRIASTLGVNPDQPGTLATHNLTDLWIQFEKAIKRDNRLEKLGAPLKKIFHDIASVDNTGMTFRYSRDLDEKTHLSEFEHINLSVLGDKLREMFNQTEDFSIQLTVLQDEYSQKTFMNHLHREKIEAIAKQLPPRKNWGKDLEAIKKEICDDFSLTSNKFSKALKLIQKHREFCTLIDLELPLEGLPIDIFTRLARIHDKKDTHTIITKDEWLRLDAVMEISRLQSYSEEYDPYLQHISSADYEGRFDPEHIARNAYARNQRLRNGLVKLGQRTLLDALAKAIPHLAEPLKIPPRLTKEELSALTDGALQRLKSRLTSPPEPMGGQESDPE